MPDQPKSTADQVADIIARINAGDIDPSSGCVALLMAIEEASINFQSRHDKP
ncbi:hypothetical protein [Asticcacaulis sp. YBE204]|uniref:hypothetical protein n=1 Tax=Asticcacaulis sp. YBE204 TaxID=1282363 RepID=UPI0012DD43EC|nr:hypothetical protein [Asticcacaulis sp. YBE204]